MSVVRFLTWIDLLFCAAFAVPGLSDLTFAFFSFVSVALGGDAFSAPVGLAAFFVNLGGFFGVLWNIAMLSYQDKRIHVIDLMARGVVIGLVVYHSIYSALPVIFFVIVFTEIQGGVFKMRWLKTLQE